MFVGLNHGPNVTVTDIFEKNQDKFCSDKCWEKVNQTPGDSEIVSLNVTSSEIVNINSNFVIYCVLG